MELATGPPSYPATAPTAGGKGPDEPAWLLAKRSDSRYMAGDPGEARIVEQLVGEEDDVLVVKSTMARGSTHNKDKTTFYGTAEKDSLSADLADLRDAQKLDMADRAMFDPENNPNEAGNGGA